MKAKNSVISPQQALYLRQIKHQSFIITFSRFLLLFSFIALWEISSTLGWIDSFFFSSPSAIVMLFIDMCKDFEIIRHIGITLLETIVSFLAVTLLSILSAILLISLPKVSKILEPFLVILNSLPKSALAPLIIVWLGTGMKTIIIAGMSVAIFGSIINMYTGFTQVEEEKQNQLNQYNQTYDNLIAERDKFTQQQQEYVDNWKNTQTQIANDNLQHQIDLYNQEKQKADQDYQREASASYSYYLK